MNDMRDLYELREIAWYLKSPDLKTTYGIIDYLHPTKHNKSKGFSYVCRLCPVIINNFVEKGIFYNYIDVAYLKFRTHLREIHQVATTDLVTSDWEITHDGTRLGSIRLYDYIDSNRMGFSVLCDVCLFNNSVTYVGDVDGYQSLDGAYKASAAHHEQMHAQL